MYPALRPGDTLIVAQVKGGDIVRGDIVCLPREGGLVAHRVIHVERGADPPMMVTKGDSLTRPDPPVALTNEYVLKVVMVSRNGRGPSRLRLGRIRALLSRKNLTYGIIRGRIGRGVRGVCGRLSDFLQRGCSSP
jgi:hypothetical protein